MRPGPARCLETPKRPMRARTESPASHRTAAAHQIQDGVAQIEDEDGHEPQKVHVQDADPQERGGRVEESVAEIALHEPGEDQLAGAHGHQVIGGVVQDGEPQQGQEQAREPGAEPLVDPHRTHRIAQGGEKEEPGDQERREGEPGGEQRPPAHGVLHHPDQGGEHGPADQPVPGSADAQPALGERPRRRAGAAVSPRIGAFSGVSADRGAAPPAGGS